MVKGTPLKKTLSGDASPQRRSLGRPRRTSPEQVLEVTLAILEREGLENFSMSRLAMEMGLSVMALYNYFPSRTALLDAASNVIFSRLQLEGPHEQWQDTVMALFMALYDHVADQPLALELAFADGRISAAWMRPWLPLARTLRQQGLTKRDLAFATNWVGKALTGLLQRDVMPAESVREFFSVPSSSMEDQVVLDDLKAHFQELCPREIFRFGARNIVGGLEELVRLAKPVSCPVAGNQLICK